MLSPEAAPMKFFCFASLFTVFALFGGHALAEEALSDPLIEEAVKKKSYVFAEFISESCPVCEEMGPVIKSVMARYPRIIHQIHDADIKVALSKKYKVKCVPVYVVVDPKGEVKFNEVGMRTVEELKDILMDAGAVDP